MGNVLSSRFHDGVGARISEISRYCVAIGTNYIRNRVEQRYRGNSTVIANPNGIEWGSINDNNSTVFVSDDQQANIDKPFETDDILMHVQHDIGKSIENNKRGTKKRRKINTYHGSVAMSVPNTSEYMHFHEDDDTPCHAENNETQVVSRGGDATSIPIPMRSKASQGKQYYYKHTGCPLGLKHRTRMKTNKKRMKKIQNRLGTESNSPVELRNTIMSPGKHLIGMSSIDERNFEESEKAFKRFRLEKFFRITSDSDIIFWDDNPCETRVKMYCGHVISAKFMVEYVESVLNKGGYVVPCPGLGCPATWPYFVVRYIIATFAYSCSEDDPMMENMNKKITENYLGILPCHIKCPGCQTWCYKDKASCVCVECPLCNFKFCWICMNQWKDQQEIGNCCGNPGCNGVDRRIESLQNCQLETIDKMECPSIRACPNCGVLTKYTRNADPNHRCQLTKCKICTHEFCFLCVKTPSEGGPCSHETRCVVAEPQTHFAEKMVVSLADEIVNLARPVDNISYRPYSNFIIHKPSLRIEFMKRFVNTAGEVNSALRICHYVPFGKADE